MPKRAASNDSVVADSEEERKKTVKSPKKGAANGKVDDPPTSGDESGAAEEDEGVYEIEAILDHQRVKGKLEYLVKWKGYDDQSNTWEPEANTEGAKDMIDEYWSQRKTHKDHPDNKRKPGRPSTGKLSKSNSKTKLESDDETANGSAKKRRQSTTAVKKDRDSDDEARPKKKQKTTEPAAVKPPRPSDPLTVRTLDPEQLNRKLAEVADTGGADADAGEPELGTMQPFMYMRTWDGMVQSIQTVEQADDNTLRVYFVIKDNGEERRVVEDSSVCAKKFPQKLIQFYESHLRWRPTESTGEPA